MNAASLLPIGGAALGGLAARSLRAIADHFSFADVLQQSEPLKARSTGNEPTSAQTTLDLNQALPPFLQQLREQLKAVGVDLSVPLTLKSDGQDGVVVDGDHPDRAVIEDLLSDSAEFSQAFHAIAAAANDRRAQQSPRGVGLFGEFRLAMSSEHASVRFE